MMIGWIDPGSNPNPTPNERSRCLKPSQSTGVQTSTASIHEYDDDESNAQALGSTICEIRPNINYVRKKDIDACISIE